MVYERLTERINGKLRLKKKFPSLNDTIDILASRLELYEDTGLSPEQVQELKEKQIPKPPEHEYIPQYKYASPTAICPICKGIVESPLMNDDYCRDCGQAIDWE